LAVLLDAPQIPKIETVNDIDCFIVNFWRAASKDPDQVAKYCDYPVHETELHARHRWIIEQSTAEFKNKLDTDVDFYDAKIAGYWVWGMGASIGNNWLQNKGLNASPILSSAGGGVHGLTANPQELFKLLQARLRRTRITCGDWKKVVSPSITYNNRVMQQHDITGIFLDPPYDYHNRSKVYKNETDVFSDVCQWALNNQNDRLRIIVCGYDNSIFPDTWQKISWKTKGGMSALGDNKGKDNSAKETIWFSPNCLKVNATT
jgi:DNA adenine methylase